MQAREQLAALEHTLLSLENPSQPLVERHEVDRCFRMIHSIKGDAGFLGFSTIRILANSMENALELFRDQTIPISSLAIERLLAAKDRLTVLVDDLENSDRADIEATLEQLKLLEQEILSESTLLVIDLSEVDQSRSGRLVEFLTSLEHSGIVKSARVECSTTDISSPLATGPIKLRVQLDRSVSMDELAAKLGLSVSSLELKGKPGRPLTIDLGHWVRSAGRSLGTLLKDLENTKALSHPIIRVETCDLSQRLPGEPILLLGYLNAGMKPNEIAHRLDFPEVDKHSSTESETTNRLQTDSIAVSQAEPIASIQAAAMPSIALSAVESEKTSSLRISVDLLDRLMTLTGELTLIRNQSVLAVDHEDGPLRPIIQRLDAVTSELQETVLRTRMQPIGNLFGKFPRVVRDLGRQLGKQVEISIVGREVELDKTILEQLSDPLTHLIRNSVDHGLETPAERIAKGKPPTGQITLTASHEDGQVRIEIRDDGRGIDPQAVRAKALAMRLKSESELERMSPRELMGLILLPGFSTAKQVTEVSGRGVGMDVVKTNIELLEGSLVIDSVLGHGTAMILRMPLTLAIIPCLIVAVNGERYAIPQRELEEAVCLHPGMSGRIEQAFDTEVYRLRDSLLPIIRFRDVMERCQPFTAEDKSVILSINPPNAAPAKIEYILVLKLPGRRFGLIVDEVRGTEEIVVKPLHPTIKRVGIFTGATIMGDGQVALIADVAGIVDHANMSFESILEANAKVNTSRKEAQAHRVLIFENGPNEQFALPLLQIRRIEMVNRDQIEYVGGREYVTIDGISLRILRLDQVLNVSAPGDNQANQSQKVSLILPKFGNQAMAIYVSSIVDTELLSVELQEHLEQGQGILGSAVVRNRLTLFLDLHGLTEKLFGRVINPPVHPIQSSSKRKRLLLVDDTPFFREVVKRYLSVDGHEIETAVDGQDALNKITNSSEFDLIVSDIEMPVMDGWEFVREARRRGVQTPILALTSLSGVSYEKKAKECGFNAYEVKLDHDRLVRKVKSLLDANQSSRWSISHG